MVHVPGSQHYSKYSPNGVIKYQLQDCVISNDDKHRPLTCNFHIILIEEDQCCHSTV